MVGVFSKLMQLEGQSPRPEAVPAATEAPAEDL
jgi:hypothetical protein